MTCELPNGLTVQIRMMQPSDAPLLRAMFGQLSERTRRLRYHGYTASAPQEEVITSADLNSGRQAAFVAVYSDETGDYIVGVSRLARASPEAVEAEMAFVVRDDFQGLGLGTRMCSVLLSAARSMGIRHLFGWVMAGNQHMMRVFKRTNLPLRVQSHAGEMLVEIPLETD